jgi:Zn-finger nucleic acid-binding protein
MDVHPYYGPGNVVIDTCSGCDMVWLDHGELKQIADAPGQDRGTRSTPPALASWPSEQSVRREDREAERTTLMDVLDELFGLG